eukprot:1810194-Rhodomonas_salina.3
MMVMLMGMMIAKRRRGGLMEVMTRARTMAGSRGGAARGGRGRVRAVVYPARQRAAAEGPDPLSSLRHRILCQCCFQNGTIWGV